MEREMAEERGPDLAVASLETLTAVPDRTIVVKLGPRSRKDLLALKVIRMGSLMDQIASMCERLEIDGKIDENAQIVVVTVGSVEDI